MSGTCNMCGKLEIYTKFWLENIKRRDQLEGLDIDGRIISK
jgi:hypothetical protein